MKARHTRVLLVLLALCSCAVFVLILRGASFAGTRRRARFWGLPQPARFSRGLLENASQEEFYAIVIDAGSSGSRIHIYRCGWTPGSKLPTVELPNKKLKLEPGLSDFEGKEAEAGASLQPLIEFAKKQIPEELHAAVPVALSATAGLRLLSTKSAELILDSCYSYLRAHSPFRVSRGAIKVISGRDEGAWGWLSANFLLKRLLGQKDQEQGTLGAVEVGGASAQVTFLLQGNETEQASEQPYALQVAGDSYPLYTHSYLGFGQDEAREKVNEALGEQPVDPCLPKGFVRPDGEYDVYYGREKVASTGSGDFAACTRLARGLMDKAAPCERPPCSFGGVHQPPLPPQGMVLFGNFYYTYKGVGPTGLDNNVSPAAMAASGEAFCTTDWADILREGSDSPFPAAENKHKDRMCFGLAYLTAFMQHGLNMAPDAQASVVGLVGGTEIEWALGEMLSMVTRGEGGGALPPTRAAAEGEGIFVGMSATQILVVLLECGAAAGLLFFCVSRQLATQAPQTLGMGPVKYSNLGKDDV